MCYGLFWHCSLHYYIITMAIERLPVEHDMHASPTGGIKTPFIWYLSITLFISICHWKCIISESKTQSLEVSSVFIY